jgi:hypothetical protein
LNVWTLNRSQKKTTLKIPPSKAWRLLHRANATSPRAAHCIANNPRTVQRSAAQRSALHRNQLASHRPAHRIPYIAAHRANATSPRAAHCIANNPRTDNQPAAHRPAAPAAHHHHTPRTCISAHALRSNLRWFRYDPIKEAAKPQWKKPKKSEDNKPEVKGPGYTYFISSDEDEPEP